MNTYYILPFALLITALSSPLNASDTNPMFPVKAAMSQDTAEEKLNGGIAFYFGKQRHGEIVQDFGQFQSIKKTKAFGKNDEEACNWAFLSAMISLQKKATNEGGNAVVNIRSYYKKNEIVSRQNEIVSKQNEIVGATEFECGAGTTIAGVTLIGNVVTLANY
jgi:uncharacterized protein YbjQ (UPF0145 family)